MSITGMSRYRNLCRATGVAIAILASAICWWQVHDNVHAAVSHATAASSPVVLSRAGTHVETVQQRSAWTTNLQNASTVFAPSLRGAQRDGRLRVDESGNLVIERGIRDLFDYYLTTLGERDLGIIRVALLKVFEQELPPAAALQAAQLLDAYLQYREQSGALEQQYPEIDENNVATVVADYFSARDRLRHDIFDKETVDTFFAADGANEHAALPRLERLQPHDTSATQSDDISMGDSFTKYRAALRAGPESGSMDALARDTLRTELFGREAAERLASLDQKRSDWETRVAQYRAQKKQLLAAGGLASSDAETMLQQLQESEFTANEIVRIRALDRLDDSGLSLLTYQ